MEREGNAASEDKYDRLREFQHDPVIKSPSVLRMWSLQSDTMDPEEPSSVSVESSWGMKKDMVIKNFKDNLRETKEELQQMKNKHKAEIREIMGNPDRANLFIALNAEVIAAKRKADGLKVDNNHLRLRIARMEQAEAKKSFDYDSWNTIAMKGGNVTNLELNYLTLTVTKLRETVSKLTKDVADRDLMLLESSYDRAEAGNLEGYQSMTVSELRETLKLKERLVTELRTMKSEYWQQIQDMREKIKVLESGRPGLGRVEVKGITVDQGKLVSLRAKNVTLEKMLEGFMRALKNIRYGDAMDMTVGGAYLRTKTSLDLCSNLSMDTPQLNAMTNEIKKLANDLGVFITSFREKEVVCKDLLAYTNSLVKSAEKLTVILDKKAQWIDDPPLVKDLRAQISNLPRPLRMILITCRNLPTTEMIDWELGLENKEVQHLKAEMKMLHVKLAKLQSENVGLKAENALLGTGNKLTTGTVGYRLALLRQQYKDRIAELELTIEEVLKQAEDELKQAYLEVRQLKVSHSTERADRTEELDAICALTQKLGDKLKESQKELTSTKSKHERRILVLVKNYEDRIAELEMLNHDLREEVSTLNEELGSLREQSDSDTKRSQKELQGSTLKNGNERLRKTLRAAKDENVKLKHKYNFTTEESRNKIRSLQDQIKMAKIPNADDNALIMELRKRLKDQEREMATESKIAMKISEKIIDRLQKRLAEQQRKLEQMGSSKDLLSDGEKRQLDAQIAALHKDLRIKEVDIEEITAYTKYSTERYEKEIERLTREKCKYRELCSKLKKELTTERTERNLMPESPSKDRQRRQSADSKRQREMVQKLRTKAATAEQKIKKMQKKVLTITLEHETESDALMQRLKTQRENQWTAMKQTRDKYETQISDLIINCEERITKIRSSFEEKLRISSEVEKSSIDQRLEMLRAQNAEYIKTLRVDHRLTVSDILKRFKKQLQERDGIIARYDKSILVTIPNFEQTVNECSEIESDHHRALDSLRKQMNRIEDVLAEEDAKGAANERRTRELEGSIVKLKRLFEASEERLKNNITMLEEQNEILKREYEEDLVALTQKKQASQMEKAAKLQIRWPRRRNITLLLNLQHEKYLAE